jgi:glycosyltransferase involved in cell wall biosynthesis
MAEYIDLVQICLPTHNGESHLAEALDSLLGQTHRNIEVVIMDNASTDGTARIAQGYASKDSRIRYYRSEEYVCATDNWNRAFEKVDPSRSEYFMWASDDDLWEKNYIEALLCALKRNTNLVLAYSQFDNVDENNKVVGVGGYRSVFPIGSEFKRVRSLIVTGQYSAIYGVIRLSAINWKPCLTDISFGADLLFMIQLCIAGSFKIVKEPLFFKRIGGISATNEDLSASRDPRIVWNVGKDWSAISRLKCNVITKLYIYNRLKVSAKILYVEKYINPILLPWVWMVMLRSNPRAFGLRSRMTKFALSKHKS